MKVLQVTSAHTRDDIRIYKKISKSLNSHFKVSFLVADGLGDQVTSHGIRVFSVNKPKSRLYRFLITPIILFFKILNFKKHIIHLHDPEMIIVGLLLRIFGFYVIYDSHEDLPKQVLSKKYLNKYSSYFLHKSILAFERVFLHFFTAIICASESIKNSMKLFNDTVITVNNYPIINDSFEKLERDKNTAVYIGGISEIRGIKELVRSLEFSEKINKLRLIGSFNDENLYNEVKKMKGWEKVDYYGQLEHEKANLILRKSEVAVVTFLPVPNHLESQPNKLFEYLESKTPILISNFKIWKEFIDKYNCGLTVDPTNPQEIASTLDKLFSTLNLNQMGEIGYKTIIDQYNWENESKKLIELYNNIK